MSSSHTRRTREPVQPGWQEFVGDLVAVAFGLTGIIGATYFAWEAFWRPVSFFGEQATAADYAEAGRLWTRAAAVGAGAPLIGLLLALWVGRRAMVKCLFVLLVPGAVLSVLVAGVALLTLVPDPPAEDPGSPACQEHSGGDNRCPGG